MSKKKFAKVENFPPKVEKIPISLLGMKLGKREGLDAKKNFTKVENFPPKVENFPPLQNVPIHVILE